MPQGRVSDCPTKPALPFAWFAQNACVWSGVEFVSAPGRGVYALATQNLPRNSVVAAVPKTAVLSRKNAAASQLLQRLLDEGLPEVEVLALAVALERAAGRRSKWYSWLRVLADYEPLPMLWSAAELRLLCGTTLDVTSRRRRQRLVENYRAIREIWAEVISDGDGDQVILPSLDAYLRASTLVSSRSFHIDEQHGVALLPLGDYFNHKCALVPDSHSVLGGGRNECGESDGDGSESARDEVNEAHDRDFEHEEGSPHSRSGSSSEGDEGADGLALRLDLSMRVSDTSDDGPAMFITRRQLLAGEEVCLTYGELGNCELLAGYGFTLDHNPFDTVLMSSARLADAASDAIGERACRRRLRALRQSHVWDDLVDRNFVFDRRATAPTELALFLHLLIADEPLPYWTSQSGTRGQPAKALDVERAQVVVEWSSMSPREALERASRSASRGANGARILQSAIRKLLQEYPRLPELSDEKLDTQKRAQATRLVTGEIQIWESVLSWLQSEFDDKDPKRKRKLATNVLSPRLLMAAEHGAQKRRRD